VASFGAGAQWFSDIAVLTQSLTTALAKSGAEVRLLVKGSRFNRLERVVSALTGDNAAGQGH
jgi:UDP-N-acetylmuramyl pentapeptide synthase